VTLLDSVTLAWHPLVVQGASVIVPSSENCTCESTDVASVASRLCNSV
jgi:hypothetical protein